MQDEGLLEQPPQFQWPQLEGGESQLARVLEVLPLAAYTCAPDGLITYFNSHARQLWGRAPKLNDPDDRFCGSCKLFATDGTSIPHDQCWAALALQTGKHYNGCEIIIERPDGSRATVLAHVSPLRDESGKIIYDGPRKLDSEICSVLGTELLEGRGWERRESITVQRSRRRLH